MVRDNQKGIVVVCHGLTGGTDCNYIKDSMNKLFKAGFTVVCVNLRGVAYSKLTVLIIFSFNRHPNIIVRLIRLI